MADCSFYAAARHWRRWQCAQALLRQRVGGHCNRLSDCGAASGRAGRADAHAQPDGIPERAAGPPRA